MGETVRPLLSLVYDIHLGLWHKLLAGGDSLKPLLAIPVVSVDFLLFSAECC